MICVCDLDMLCRNGGLIGAITNGGFAEYIEVHEKELFQDTILYRLGLG